MNHAFFLTMLFPFFGALLFGFAPRKYKPALSCFALAGAFIASLFLIPQIAKSGPLLYLRYLSGWFNLSFIADGLAVFMAVVSSFAALLISLYSLDYMKEYEEKNLFYFWMLLFVGSMIGLIFSANLLLLFLFWEVTSLCSWRLIGFYRKEEDAKAADKAFLITFFGASLMLAGIALIYLNYGTLEMASLKGLPLINSAAFLLLAGVVSKSAQLPLQSWLPDAGVAPTPVTALLHAAVLVKIGIYVFARVFGQTFLVTQSFLNLALALSVATIIVAAASALVENNMKRILAYSTISQLGYIMAALSLNSDISFKIALIYILAHSLAKAGLFLCAGIIEHKAGTKNINELGGLWQYMPYTGTAYLLCAFSIIGIPPFLGFWPKAMLVLACLKSGHILAGSLMVLGAVFTLFYLMRLFNSVFFGETKIKTEEDKRSIMLWVVLILGGLSLLFGLCARIPFNFVSLLIG